MKFYNGLIKLKAVGLALVVSAGIAYAPTSSANPNMPLYRAPIKAQEQVQIHQQNTYAINNDVYNRHRNTLAKIILGEARDCDLEEQIAVGHVALNRLTKSRAYGSSLEEVARKSFSSFRRVDANYKVIMNPEKYEPISWKNSLEVADKILRKEYSDNTGGATFYHHRRILPYWAKKKDYLHRIGRLRTENGFTEHVFYREKRLVL